MRGGALTLALYSACSTVLRPKTCTTSPRLLLVSRPPAPSLAEEGAGDARRETSSPFGCMDGGRAQRYI